MLVVEESILDFERNGLVDFDPMESEGRKGLEGEEGVEVQQKKEEAEEEGRKGMIKGESSSLSTLSLFWLEWPLTNCAIVIVF